MQVYKEFSILSSRPKQKDTKKINHHLYGIISAKKYFSTGHWLKLAKLKIKECLKLNKVPVIVGGTGLYFKAITKGISQIPEIDSKFRNKIRNLHFRIGQSKFYERLLFLDPKVDGRIAPNDTQRTIRAYEVKLFTNKSLYEWASNTKSDFLDFDIKKIFIDIPREDLLKQIEKRTKLMFQNNCIGEVEKFLKLKINATLSANKIIGVREIINHLLGVTRLNETMDLINIKTRQYAKRQNTWSRGHMSSWNKVYSNDLSILIKKVLKLIS